MTRGFEHNREKYSRVRETESACGEVTVVVVLFYIASAVSKGRKVTLDEVRPW